MKRFERSGRERKRRTRRRPINVLASVLTTFSLYCGIASIFASINMEHERAAYWILAAIVLDTLDGAVARMTNSVSDFGKELDSLSDIVTCGVAPAVLIYTAYLMEGEDTGSILGPIGSMMAIIFVICSGLRLARFNAYQSTNHRYFTGLPVPAAAGTIASFALFAQHFELQVAFWIFGPATLVLAYLMVSTIRYPKEIKIFILAPKHAFRLLVLSVVVIVVFDFASQRSPAIVLLPLGLAYVLFGIVNEIYRRVARREEPAPLDTGTDPQADGAPTLPQASPSVGGVGDNPPE